MQKIFNLSKEQLEDMYINKLLSSHKIAKILNMHSTTIQYWIKKYKIKVTQEHLDELNHRKRLGFKHSQKTKDKIAKAHIGFKHSEESKRKMSENTKKNPIYYGSNNWNWKGGVTSLRQLIRNCPKMNFWRKSILQRDNFTCQYCGKRGGDLNVHHLISFEFILDLFLHKNNKLNVKKR